MIDLLYQVLDLCVVLLGLVESHVFVLLTILLGTGEHVHLRDIAEGCLVRGVFNFGEYIFKQGFNSVRGTVDDSLYLFASERYPQFPLHYPSVEGLPVAYFGRYRVRGRVVMQLH